MINAIFRVMMLGLLRDRGALAMAFILPPVIYMIFAAIFSVTAGGDLRLKVAILDQVRTETSQRLANALRNSADIRALAIEPASVKDIEEMVRRADIDVGVIIRSDPGSTAANSQAPVLVIGDAARSIAGPIVTGHLLRLFGEYLPDTTYRRTIADFEQQFLKLSSSQRERVDLMIEGIKREAIEKEDLPRDSKSARRGQLVEQATLSSRAKASATVVYYAGAVGFMFLLFSAIQGAMSLIDERQNGIVDRMLAGAGSVGTLLSGKFLFLLLQGVVQVGLIFLLAELAYGVEVRARWPEWLAITVAATGCVVSLALALAALCKTRQQAATLSNFLVLVMSAIGGSMVPRFLMPDWLQDVSWLIPNAWAIEAYNILLWRDAQALDLLLPVALLTGVSVVGFAIAAIALKRSVQS